LVLHHRHPFGSRKWTKYCSIYHFAIVFWMTGRNDAEHLEVLDKVFGALHTNGLWLNIDKCSFLRDRLEYCGHVLTKDGIQQSPTKIEAIVSAPVPQNVSQLRSLLGLITYYNTSTLPAGRGSSDTATCVNDSTSSPSKYGF